MRMKKCPMLDFLKYYVEIENVQHVYPKFSESMKNNNGSYRDKDDPTRSETIVAGRRAIAAEKSKICKIKGNVGWQKRYFLHKKGKDVPHPN